MNKMDVFTNEERIRYQIIWDELEKHYDKKSKRLLAAVMAKSRFFSSR